MNKIILYGSHYGTARRYAEELSKRTGIPALPSAAVPEAGRNSVQCKIARF